MIERVIIKNYKGIKSADIKFHDFTNIIVGNNGVGKSTIIEAMSLALGYGLNSLEVTPNLFHHSVWEEFRETKELPEIYIEVIFKTNPELAEYSGKNHSLHPEELIGIHFSICFDEDYRDLFELEKVDCKHIPCEYYKIERYWFSDAPVKQFNIPYNIQLIDSTSAFFNSRTNQYITRIIQSKLSEKENIIIKKKLRKIKQNFEEDEDVIEINRSLSLKTEKVKKDFSISVDLNSKSAWNTIMCPVLEEIPFNQIGLGEQCIIKTLLSIDNKENKKESIVIIEEPESHLSHTKMHELLQYLSDRTEGQLFVTTHSSFVANRLELNNLILIANTNGVISDSRISIAGIDIDVYKYFFKTCNYPTLRLTLCKKAVLVEGPTDEMLVTYYYKTQRNKHPFDDGIELMSVTGVAFKHFIQLAKSLNIKLAIITDNDGKSEDEIINLYNSEKSVNIGVFTEKERTLNTLEPSFVNKNITKLNSLSKVVRKKKEAEETKEKLIEFMENNKTEWAYRLLSSLDEDKHEIFNVPDYITSAISWLNE